MLEMISWGQGFLQALQDVASWMSSPIGSLASLLGPGADFIRDLGQWLGIGAIMNTILDYSFLPFGSVGALVIGGSLTFVLGYKVIKFFVDMVA